MVAPCATADAPRAMRQIRTASFINRPMRGTGQPYKSPRLRSARARGCFVRRPGVSDPCFMRTARRAWDTCSGGSYVDILDGGEGLLQRVGWRLAVHPMPNPSLFVASAPTNGLQTTAALGTMLGAVAPREQAEGFAVAVADGFGYWTSGELTIVDPVLPEAHRMNDAKCDSRGRLWAGSTHRAPGQPGRRRRRLDLGGGLWQRRGPQPRPIPRHQFVACDFSWLPRSHSVARRIWRVRMLDPAVMCFAGVPRSSRVRCWDRLIG